MDVPLTSRTRVPAHVLTRELDEELVILNMKTEKYLGLDDVGTRMWKALDDAPSIQAALETLLETYAVDRERLQRDLMDLIDQMVEQGLIELDNE